MCGYYAYKKLAESQEYYKRYQDGSYYELSVPGASYQNKFTLGKFESARICPSPNNTLWYGRTARLLTASSAFLASVFVYKMVLEWLQKPSKDKMGKDKKNGRISGFLPLLLMGCSVGSFYASMNSSIISQYLRGISENNVSLKYREIRPPYSTERLLDSEGQSFLAKELSFESRLQFFLGMFCFLAANTTTFVYAADSKEELKALF